MYTRHDGMQLTFFLVEQSWEPVLIVCVDTLRASLKKV